MSYKKSAILQELQQAIKRKANEKSKNKDQMSKFLQTSVQKKKKETKTNSKELRLSSNYKNSINQANTVIKIEKAECKPVSLFNNENLMGVDAKDFRVKKYNNRKLDKVISLINYVISSSEKAIKYINSNNFEAEFAIKLYRSDKDNLQNQLKNLSLEDIIDSQRSNEQSNSKLDLNSITALTEENARLKKDVIILQKQAERFHKTHSISLHNGNEQHLDVVSSANFHQKQLHKLKDCLRKIIPFDQFKMLTDIVIKESKFQLMELKCLENSKKISEISEVLLSLEVDKNHLIQNIAKFRDSTKSTAFHAESPKIRQIQEEKILLEKQLASMKLKLSQFGESSKLICQNELLKKNHELLYEKLHEMMKQFYPIEKQKSANQSSSTGLLDLIQKQISTNKQQNSKFQSRNNELQLEIEELQEQMQKVIEHYEIKQKSHKNQELHLIIEQFQNQKDVYENAIADLKVKILKLEALIQAKELETTQFASMEITIKEQFEIIAKLKEDIQGYRKKHSLNQSIHDKSMTDKELLISKLNKQILIKEVDCESLTDENNRLKQIIQNKAEKQKNNKYPDNQEIIKAIKEKLDLTNRTNKELNQIIESKNLEISKMQQKQTELSSQMMSIRMEVQQNMRLKADVENTNKENFKLTTKNIQFQKISLNLKAEVKDKEKQIESLSLKYNQAINISNQISLQLDQQIYQNKINQESLSRQKELIETFGEQNKVLLFKIQKDKLVQLKSIQQIQERQKQIQKLNSKLKQKTQLIQTFKKKNQQLINQIYDLKESQIPQIPLQIQSQNNKLAQIQKKLAQNQQLITSLVQQNNNLKEQLSLKQIEIQNLDERNNILMKKQQDLIGQKQQKESNFHEEYEIHKMKLNQYTYLVKQILKGILVDEDEDIKNIIQLEELLEYGSRKVLELRKRNREQQSNKRKTHKSQYQYSFENHHPDQIHQFISNQLDDVKTKLFSDAIPLSTTAGQIETYEKDLLKSSLTKNQLNCPAQKDSPSPSPSQKIKDQNRSANQLSDFNDLKQNNLNDSVLSEQEQHLPEKHHQNLQIQQFNKLETQKMTDSMILQEEMKEQAQICNQVRLNQNKSANNFEDFNDFESQKINDSMISAHNQQQLQADENTEKAEQKINDIDEFAEMKESNLNDSVLSKQPASSFKDHKLEQNLDSFGQISAIQKSRSQSKVPVMSQNKFADNKLNVKSEGNFLEEFQEFNSDKMNDSVVSEYKIEESPKEKQKLVEHNGEAEFEAFNDLHGSSMNDSMMSKNNEDQSIHQSKKVEIQGKNHEANFDEFDQYQSDGVNNSMLSEQAQAESLELKQINKSAEKIEGNDLSAFDDIKADNLNDSVLSEQSEQP